MRWNAPVRILRLFSEDKPYVAVVTCYKLTAEHPERAGYLWVRRWIDLNA
jgi:hypothetical protein